MNIQKFIAIVAAILINCAALAWFNAVGAHAVASAIPASADPTVVTLPTTTVRPSGEQLRMLREERTKATPRQASVGAGSACAEMPYYSFAESCTTEATPSV